MVEGFNQVCLNRVSDGLHVWILFEINETVVGSIEGEEWAVKLAMSMDGCYKIGVL